MRQNRRNFLKSAAAVTGSAVFVTNHTRVSSQAVAQTARAAKPVEVFINQ
jgi:hypothetical protein